MTYVHQVRNCLRAKITKQKGVTLFYNVERASELREPTTLLFSLELSYLQYDDNRG